MSDAASNADESVAAPGLAGAQYTAVIYFHGMGSQRRFEESSRLIDGLDSFLADSHAQGNSRGFLSKIAPRLEPARDDPSKTYTFIRVLYHPSASKDAPNAQIRFYEVYWAPLMVGERSPTGVLRWMFRQVLRPWGTLTSPWRERQRLRRATLAALYEERRRHPPGVEARDFSTLARHYNDFEGPDALRNYREGSFDQFIDFLARCNSARPETAKRQERLARAWRDAYRRQEILNAFILLTLALTLLLLGLATTALALALLERATTFFADTALESLSALAPPTLQTAFVLVAAMAAFFGLSSFLTEYLGDVEAWATYEETNEKHERRAKVIDIGASTLAHVLGDERCERAVVLGHSLGSSIAHDTLLSVLRFNRARNRQDPILGPVPLHKVEHFVTLGSPIDKIEYFFESYRSEFHRYRRVVEYLRGDICTEPFCRNRKPSIHWINFWDDADPVSGPLHSPAGHRGFTQRVDNVHVESLTFPNPGASHRAYFFNSNVVECLFGVIFLRSWSFRTLPRRQGQDYDWESAYLGGPLDYPGRRRGWLHLAAFIPWASLAGLVAYAVEPAWGPWPWAPAGLAALTLAVASLLSRGRRPRRHRSPGSSSEEAYDIVGSTPPARED
ncbi:hypothetical protein QMO56_25805 [Roseomonas sp. E05]|uniref:hypothetical protein n=1 Tax=Roseomonas sp. E05 TaxID=3046310 RepID=UPI0024B997C0|nr:hypothetical protein [Roseomonas sp. E05]MDJ0391523.1 hypothetical protein [Roseomonas sp. E05]